MHNKYRDLLVNIISEHLPDAQIYLFGSRARQDQRSGSDIDIAINNTLLVDEKILNQIREKIENSTVPFFVDIVDINAVSSSFKQEILKDHVIWKSSIKNMKH